MKKSVFLLMMALIMTGKLSAQPSLIIGNVTSCSNDTILIPVSIANLPDLGALSIYISYDPAILTLPSNPYQNLVVNINPLLTDVGSFFFGPMSSPTQIVGIQWFSGGMSPLMMSDGILFYLKFYYKGSSSPTPLDFGTILPVRTEAYNYTNEMLVSVTLNNGSVSLSQTQCPSLKGKLTYDNAPVSTPLSFSKVYLKTSGGTLADSTITDVNGDYSFSGTTPGTYSLSARSSITQGGYNGVDALLAMQHFTQTITLTGIRLKAADVNGSGYINSADALAIAKRYVNLITTFPVGNWTFEEPEVIINGTMTQVINFKGACYGDVNGSYTPPCCGNK